MLTTAATNYVVLGLGGVAGLLAARALGPEGRGELAAMQTWPLLLGAIGVLGLPDALVYVASGQRQHGRSLALTATALALGSTLVFAAVGYAAMPRLLGSQSNATVDAARMALTLTPLFALSVSFHALRGLELYSVWNALRLLSPLAWLLIVAIGGVYLKLPPRDLTFLYIAAAAMLIIPYNAIVWRHLMGPPRPQRRLVRPLVRFGLPSALTFIPQTLTTRLDQMLMIGMFEAEQLGTYVVAVTWASLTSPLVNSIGTVLFSTVARSRERHFRSHAVAAAFHTSIVVGAGASLFMVVITPLVLPMVLGSSYEAAIGLAQILVAASFVMSLNLVLSEALRGYGRPASVLRSEVVGLVSTGGLLLLLLPSLELIGAAIASLLSYFIVFVFLLLQIRVVDERTFRALLEPKRADLGRYAQGMNVLRRRSGEQLSQQVVDAGSNSTRDGLSADAHTPVETRDA